MWEDSYEKCSVDLYFFALVLKMFLMSSTPEVPTKQWSPRQAHPAPGGTQNTSDKWVSVHKIHAEPHQSHTWASTREYLIWDDMNFAFCSSCPSTLTGRPQPSFLMSPNVVQEDWTEFPRQPHQSWSLRKTHPCWKSSDTSLVPGTCSWHCVSHSASLFYPPPARPLRSRFTLFCRWGNWSTKGYNNLLKVTQAVNGGAGIWVQVWRWFQFSGTPRWLGPAWVRVAAVGWSTLYKEGRERNILKIMLVDPLKHPCDECNSCTYSSSRYKWPYKLPGKGGKPWDWEPPSTESVGGVLTLSPWSKSLPGSLIDCF